MKKTLSILCIAFVLLQSTGCEKRDLTTCNKVAAKIIRYDCDRVIFQLLTPEVIGDTNWVDVQTGLQYSNVVSYYNTCKIAEFTNGEKVTLYVTLKQPDNDTSIPCVQCLAVSQNPPQTKVDFVSISKEKCLEDNK